MHAAFTRKLVALEEIAVRAGGDDIAPGGSSPPRARHHMIEGELVGGEAFAAILANEPIAQKDIEAGKGWMPRERDILLERNHAGQAHFDGRASDHMVIARDDIDPLQAHRLDGVLPGP